jgi:hypothetical protein
MHGRSNDGFGLTECKAIEQALDDFRVARDVTEAILQLRRSRCRNSHSQGLHQALNCKVIFGFMDDQFRSDENGLTKR